MDVYKTKFLQLFMKNSMARFLCDSGTKHFETTTGTFYGALRAFGPLALFPRWASSTKIRSLALSETRIKPADSLEKRKDNLSIVEAQLRLQYSER